MATSWIVVLAFSALMWSCDGQTLQDVLSQRPELVEFWNFISNTEISSVLGQQSVRFTVFAPTNEAMRRLPQEVMQEFIGSSSKSVTSKEQFITYHIVPVNPDTSRPYDTNDFKDSRVETIAKDAPKLFLRTYQVGQERGYYVNGARVVMPDIDATNGRVQIIDSVLFPIAVKRNAFSLVEYMAQNTKSSESTKTFNELLNQVKYKRGSPHQYLNSDSTFVTLFVPSDESLKKVLTRQRKDELMNDEEQILDLLNRHIIKHDVSSGGMQGDEGVKGVWHAALMNAFIDNAIESGRDDYGKIPALKGEIKPMRVGNTLYVTNVCGMVRVLDLPVRMYGDDGMDSQNPNDGGRDFGNNNNNDYNNNNNNDDNDYNYQQRQSGYQPTVTAPKYKVMANLTVNNGVVHLVDGLMGYIYNSAMEMLEEDEEISKFKDHVLATQSFRDKFTVRGSTVPNKKYTIFAPVNSAFQNIEEAKNIDLSQNEELRLKVLGMHTIEGEMSLTDLAQNSRAMTLESTQSATFSSDRYGSYVEVDRIRARIVRADVCVKNGIIHYIDNLLGVPYQNLKDVIDSDDKLIGLKDLVDATPKFIDGNRQGLRRLPLILEEGTPERTFFAPTNFAIDKMRSTQVGRMYANRDNADKLYFLLLRHTPVGQFYIEDNIQGPDLVPNSDQLYVSREGDEYFVEFRSPDYGTAKAKILERNLRMTNGVVHMIDTVLFINNQGAFEIVGAASNILPSVFVLISSILIKLLL